MPFSPQKPAIEYSNRATKSRFVFALVLSLLANVVLWQTVSLAARNRNGVSSQPIEITRLVFASQGKRVDKTVESAQIAQRVAQIQQTLPHFSQSQTLQSQDQKTPRLEPRNRERDFSAQNDSRQRENDSTNGQALNERNLRERDEGFSRNRVLDSPDSSNANVADSSFQNERASGDLTTDSQAKTFDASNHIALSGANNSSRIKRRQNATKSSKNGALNSPQNASNASAKSNATSGETASNGTTTASANDSTSREFFGKNGNRNDGNSSGNAQSGNAQSGNAQSGNAQSGNAQSGNAQSQMTPRLSTPEATPRFTPQPNAQPTRVPTKEPTREPTKEPLKTPTSTPRPTMEATPRMTPNSPPKPTPEPTPKRPRGITREASATRQISPRIPESLRDETFKSSVRARVLVRADGSFDVALRSSSGNAQIDELALSALRRWRWKPALQNGEAIESTQSFRIEFEVN